MRSDEAVSVERVSAMSNKRPRLGSTGEPRRLTIRLTPEDYDRLSALAANEGVAMAAKGRELMISAMDPQIFGERYHDVEGLLRGVVRDEMAAHSERLHKRLYRNRRHHSCDGVLRSRHSRPGL